MSNNNHFWAKRFGYTHKDGSLALVYRSYGGSSHTGQHTRNKNGVQSRRDKAKYQLMIASKGFPIVHYGPTGRRIVV